MLLISNSNFMLYFSKNKKKRKICRLTVYLTCNVPLSQRVGFFLCDGGKMLHSDSTNRQEINF